MGGIIRQNYLWAVGFNSIGLALATFGILNPIVAALLHHFSSVFVVVNAGRLYFTGIEQSVIGSLFRKMDEVTNRKRICREGRLESGSENAAETVLEQES
ncbi:MAG: hypothetical protein Q8L15_08975 [Methylobacter sp.]|nr:hypothetical protein [Methylobacter sp.]